MAFNFWWPPTFGTKSWRPFRKQTKKKKKPWIYLFSPQPPTFNTKSWRSKREKEKKKSNFFALFGLQLLKLKIRGQRPKKKNSKVFFFFIGLQLLVPKLKATSTFFLGHAQSSLLWLWTQWSKTVKKIQFVPNLQRWVLKFEGQKQENYFQPFFNFFTLGLKFVNGHEEILFLLFIIFLFQKNSFPSLWICKYFLLSKIYFDWKFLVVFCRKLLRLEVN